MVRLTNQVAPLGIIGGLYAGLFTPTEAGAAGAVLAFTIALVQKRLTFAVARDSKMNAIATTSKSLINCGYEIALPNLTSRYKITHQRWVKC